MKKIVSVGKYLDGSKNRINLGFVVGVILHFHRNFYKKHKIYMSKRVQMKIREKHSEVKKYTALETFQNLMQSTVACCRYDKCKDTINSIYKAILYYN